MKIEKSLKIHVTQADVEQALIEMIARQEPTIAVDSIDFTPKRQGEDKISVRVDAHFKEDEPSVISRLAGAFSSKDEVVDELEEEVAEATPVVESRPSSIF